MTNLKNQSFLYCFLVLTLFIVAVLSTTSPKECLASKFLKLQQENRLVIDTTNNNNAQDELIHYLNDDTSLLVKIYFKKDFIFTQNNLNLLTNKLNINGDWRDSIEIVNDLDRYFKLRLKPSTLINIRKDEYLNNNIILVERVSGLERATFSKIDLDTLRFSSIRLVMDDINKNKRDLNILEKLKNKYELQKSNRILKSKRNINLSNEVLNDLNFVFDLDWKMKSNNQIEISLKNYDINIYNTYSTQNNNGMTPVNHIVTKFNRYYSKLMNEQTIEMYNEISNELGNDLMNTLINQEEITSIDRIFPQNVENYGTNQVIQSGGANYDYLWKKGIDGSGEVIGLVDTGVYTKHCFFYNADETYSNTVRLSNRKIVAYEPLVSGDNVDSSGHGTHVGGTIVGNSLGSSSSDPINQESGVAKNAKLYVLDAHSSTNGFVVDDVQYALKTPFTNAGARISSNSWGCSNPYLCEYDCTCYIKLSNNQKGSRVQDSTCQSNYGRKCCQLCNTYDTTCKDVDTFLNKNDEIVFVKSAGNAGTDGSSGTISNPAGAKSSIAVGASYSTLQDYQRFQSNPDPKVMNMQNMASFSSRGPSIDGRIKPDIASPGYYIVSSSYTANVCAFNGGLALMSGTSMACPSVSGAAALVRQYLSTRLNSLDLVNKEQKTIAGTLVKAMVIHSGEQMTGTVSLDGTTTNTQSLSSLSIPNNYFGFGRINLKNSLLFPDDSASSDAIGNLYTINRAYLDPGKSVTIGFNSTASSGKVKATLTWYDLPSAVTTNTKSLLINDIDLKVIVNGVAYYGNENLNGKVADSVNTVESITVTGLSSTDTVEIQLSAKSTNVGQQTISLVVSGNVRASSSSIGPLPSDFLNPNNNASNYLTASYSLILMVVSCIIIYLL
ncbi:hypothetical protein ABK040_007123 [Willaertia magna]